MEYKRILTIQDISCVGQCSLTVALPIISACGHETAILPSAVLSTHTWKFRDFTFRDLTDDIPAIQKHWQDLGIQFDAICTGYLGSIRQIDYVADIFATMAKKDAPKIVDPVIGDNGQMYSIFDMEYARAMAGLCSKADIVLPNITEACFMTGTEYREHYDEAYVTALCRGLTDLGMKTVVLTGVSYNEDTTGVAVYTDGRLEYYRHEKLGTYSHGTGDIYAAAFTGAYMCGKSTFEAAGIAAEYVLKCIRVTGDDSDHWYGVKFELVLEDLIKAVR